MSEISKVNGVVVTYFPTMDCAENLRAMVRECGRLLVVDNGSGPEICAWLAAIPGVELLALGENRGVAAALNLGAAWARRNRCSWLITFDQDSTPEPGLTAALWATHLRYPEAAVVGPRILEGDTNGPQYRWVRSHPKWPWLFQRVECDHADLPSVTMLITSGSMIELEEWAELGGYVESFFIDYVDVDYCLRAIRAGRSIAVSAGARLRHHLGARQAGRLLGKDFRPTHHAAIRHYFIARNRIAVWRFHALAMLHWALFDFAFACFNGVRVLAFEREKGHKLWAMILGTWDGWRGRSGPCPPKRRRALIK